MYQSAIPVFQTFYINATSLEQWRLTNFGTASNSDAAADDVNLTGDDIPNLLRYATGISALTANYNPLTNVTPTSDATRLTITFNRIADPLLTYRVEATNDLTGTWEIIWSSTGDSNAAGAVTVTDSVLISGQPLRFLRMRVSY